MSFLFIQMADPQFGMYEHFSKLTNKEIEYIRNVKGMNILDTHDLSGLNFEIENFNKAIDIANFIKPKFVIICGDMINSTEQDNQYQNFIKICDRLSKDIKIYFAPGNHDIDNQEITKDSLENYRKSFGNDQYYFDYNNYRFIVINSNVTFNPYNQIDKSDVIFFDQLKHINAVAIYSIPRKDLDALNQLPDEWEKQLNFLKTTLKESNNIKNKVVFLHHPLFINSPYEENNFISIHKPHRNILLSLFDLYGVNFVFAGHWHRNSYTKYKNIEIITSGPVGYPLGKDPSGIRILKASDSKLIHKYYALDSTTYKLDF